MLAEVLQIVRGLVDSAIETEDHRPASVLSSLASKLEFAVRAERKVMDRYTEQSRLDELTAKMVDDFLGFAGQHLDEDDLALVAGVIRESLPRPRERDGNVIQLEREIGQVKGLLDSAIEGRQLGDVRKLAQLLIAKHKALTAARVEAKELVDEDFVKAHVELVVNVVTSPRAMVDDENFNDAVAHFTAERMADYGE